MPDIDTVALALDPSPKATGWAIGRPNGPKPVFGVFKLPTWGDDEPLRLKAFEAWLVRLVEEYRVTAIYYEAPFMPSHGNFDSVKPQLFVDAVILLLAGRLGLDVAEVRVDDWRKWAFGYCRIPGMKGDAARKEWKRLALVKCAKAGLLVEDDNAAEACCILDFGLSDADRKHRRESDIRHRRAELDHWMGERR